MPLGATHRGESSATLEPVDIPDTIICVDCGGTAHLLSYPRPDEPWKPGDIVAYRCADCLDRWDLVIDDDEGDQPDPTY